MADWAPAAATLADAAAGFDARFRAALADDLAMPTAVVVVNELVSAAEVPDGEKYALLAAWDHLLGLDLEREATAAWEPGDDVVALIEARDSARAAKDFATSDRLRDELAAMGLEVMDTPAGTRVRPRT
jgi:cysteinyl-tRNA synthetase